MPYPRVSWTVVGRSRAKKTADGSAKRYKTHYSIRYWSGNAKKELYTGLTVERQAWKLGEKLEAEGFFNGSPILNDYAKDFYAEDSWYVQTERADRNNALGAGTLPGMQSNLRLILREFGHLNLRQITTDFLDQWFLDQMVKHDKSTATLSNYKKALRPIFRKAIKDGHLSVDPTSTLSPLGVKALTKEAFPNWDMHKMFTDRSLWYDRKSPPKMGKLWEDMGFMHHIMLLVSASTGMRIGEVQALRVNDLEPDDLKTTTAMDDVTGDGKMQVTEVRSMLWLRVDETYIQRAGIVGPPKSESYRTVPLAHQLAVRYLWRMVEDIKGRMGDDASASEAFLFSPDGTVGSIYSQAMCNHYLKRVYKEIHEVKDMPRKYSVHCLRRWFNTRALILSNHNEFLTKILMGHRDKGNMTGRYNTVGKGSYAQWIKDMQPHLWGDVDDKGVHEFEKSEARKEITIQEYDERLEDEDD